MELAIPLIALGGMYVASNQNKNNKQNNNNKQQHNSKQDNNKKENFESMGAKPNYLPNTNVPPTNYPILNNKELVDNVQEYVNPNTASDKYFNQNAYEQRQRAGGKVSDTIQQVYSLSGNYMDSQEFKHNNMVPFNGGKPKGQLYNNNNAETILDNYIGSGSQTIKKIEQAPLFKPQDNVQWAYGAPNMSDFMQSRVNPALKNNMVKPFESVHVGPGLGKGFSSEGSGGFNSGMEDRDAWLDKTVDQLRVSTNPKLEYSLENLQGPAGSIIKNVGIQGKVEKYRPDGFFINSQDRWLTTTGAEKATRMVASEVFHTSNRNETTKAITGTPNSTIKTAGYAPTNHEETKRIQWEGYNVSHSTAVGRGGHSDGDINKKSHTNYENNRSTNTQGRTYGTGFSGAIGAVIAPIMDMLKPSKKEEYSCNIRVYGNMGGEVSGNYVHMPGDVTSTTIKETTIYQPNGYVGNQIDGAYQVTDQQCIANQRDTTSDYYQINPAGSKSGQRQYDAEYRQTNNESKEKSIVGRTNQGNAKQFNSSMNMSMSKLDTDRDNNRMWTPSANIALGPSTQTYGKTNAPQYVNAYQDCNRIDPGLLDAFKANPYTHSLSSAV
uniref:Uncharacterized protein n=1 Tax=viral metagenome TaxID=1070528 RepID=A0A6C0I9B4_9ZZZZ